jgi:hypothetical protein
MLNHKLVTCLGFGDTLTLMNSDLMLIILTIILLIIGEIIVIRIIRKVKNKGIIN